jgi:uncharacterized cupredoxin-like copper-binding protein
MHMMNTRLLSSIYLTLLVFVLAACGGSGAPSGSQEVKVTLSDFKIASTVSTFTAGTSYHFVVTNEGKTAHELMIMPSAMNMNGMSMDDMHKMALAHIEQFNPGETKTVDYTFASSAAGSRPEFACHLAGHYEAGMKLDVMVSS